MKVGEIFIQGAGVVSAAGGYESFSRSLSESVHHLSKRRFTWGEEWVSQCAAESEVQLTKVRQERSHYGRLDRTTIMGIVSAREAMERAGWYQDGLTTGVIVGSSRGATETFERSYSALMHDQEKRLPPFTSPVTTLGNISSSIAQDLMLAGPEISFSVTCSTALHSMLSAISWIRAGMCQRFLVGGAEAPLTEFTMAQMKALRIYASPNDSRYPCQPLVKAGISANTFVLGEGAVVLAIDDCRLPESALAEIIGIGWGIEEINSLTSVSPIGEAFSQAMSGAIEGLDHDQEIDAIIAHAPGTIMGDAAEREAIARTFSAYRPAVFSPKWQYGHTFAASAGFSILAAIHLLADRQLALPPFQELERNHDRPIRTVLVNAAGFGGNACSVLLRLPQKVQERLG